MGIIKKIVIFTVFISVVLDYKCAITTYALNIGVIVLFILFLNLFYGITILRVRQNKQKQTQSAYAIYLSRNLGLSNMSKSGE